MFEPFLALLFVRLQAHELKSILHDSQYLYKRSKYIQTFTVENL